MTATPGPFGPPEPDFGGYPPPPARPEAGSTLGYPVPAAPSRPRRTVATAAVVAALVGGGVGAGTVALFDNSSTTVVSSGLSGTTSAAPTVKIDGSISAAAAKIGPSVVTIDVVTSSAHDTGSGVVLRSDGYILTNNHVISSAGSGAKITVTMSDGRAAQAKVVGTDPSDDLAVIQVPLTKLTAATFTSSKSLVVGQTVVAVGAPLGLSDTVTSGIVSTVARPVSTGNAASGDGAVFNAIQTDAAINPGNSGGPLVDLNGNVVGINAAIATDSSSGGLQVPGQQSQSGNIGIGFAIPSDEASRIAAELIATGKATHALMGLSVADAPTTGSSSQPGASVRTLTAGGPASKAGIKAGDVLTNLGGQRIDSANALVAAVRSHAPGETVAVTYVRNSRSTTVQVTLGSAS
ncbi:MAG: putative serine protease PepD [Pseudonocardiales bacterium]|jgi:putative serine protease PepD|nr:putative serine protease PepD [Pseudonocardiales bacterium]